MELSGSLQTKLVKHSIAYWFTRSSYYIWRFMLDERYQGKGYGRKAAALAIHILKTADSEKPIKLSTEACNEKAQGLYLSLGFQKLPELDGDDIVFGL